MLSTWTTLVTLFLHVTVYTAQIHKRYPYSKLFYEQVVVYDLIESKADDSCYVKQHFGYDTFVICPTQRNCYVKTYSNGNQVKTITLYEADVDGACVTTDGKSLPVEKMEQLDAVLRMLRLTNETVCEFSVIETLDARRNGLVNVGQLGGSGCGSDECPYQLKYLELSFNKIDKLSNNSFCRFERLEHLAMIDCGIIEIEENSFVDLVNLKELFLNFNNLTYLPLNLFANNTKLQTIGLGANRLRTNDLKAILPIRSLQYLFMYRNRISFADAQLTFPSSLVEFIMENNSIDSIGSELIDLNNATDLVINNNNISEIDENAFQNMLNVTYVYLRGNEIETLHPGTFRNNLKLETLSLSINRLVRFPPIAHLSSLQYFAASGNLLSNVTKADLVNCTRLIEIDLSHNRLSYIDSDVFSNMKRLKMLNLTDNRLSELTSDFVNSNVIELHLSLNRFTGFTFKVFSPSVNLLNLSSNRIDTIEPFDFDNRSLEFNLTLLDLAANRIDTIENLKLPNSIATIDLSSNNIRLFMPQFQLLNPQLTNLKIVYLQNNSMGVMCHSSYRYYPSSNYTIRMYVAGNPLECSCENLWIKNPRTFNQIKMADFDDVTCKQSLTYFNVSHSYELRAEEDWRFVCESGQTDGKSCDGH